jgi:hypothetical protein
MAIARVMLRPRDAFLAALLEWLNRKLAPSGVLIEADTPLFAGGLINSIRILELIAWTGGLRHRMLLKK